MPILVSTHLATVPGLAIDLGMAGCALAFGGVFEWGSGSFSSGRLRWSSPCWEFEMERREVTVLEASDILQPEVVILRYPDELCPLVRLSSVCVQ